MTSEEEIERFFASYKDRAWRTAREEVEMHWQYHYAIKHGKIVTALEIAAAILSEYRDRKDEERNIARIFKKEFPEVEKPN